MLGLLRGYARAGRKGARSDRIGDGEIHGSEEFLPAVRIPESGLRELS